MRLLSRTPRGFTLLELIVTIVILGVLAAIAVPTFAGVIDRSHDESAEVSLAAYAREVQALTAMDNAGSLEQQYFEEAGSGMVMATAPGVSASSLRVRALPAPLAAARFEKEGITVFSYAISGDKQTAGLTAISAANHCVALTMTLTTTTPEPISTDPSTCHAGSIGGNPDNSGFLTDPVVAIPPDPNFDALTAPYLTVKGSTTTDVTVKWDSVPNVTGYRVKISSTPDMASGIESDIGLMREQLVTLEPGVTKYVTVTSLRGSEASSPSNVLAVTALPAAPQNVRTSTSGTQVTVSWDAVPGAAGYYVYQDSTDGAAEGTFTRAVVGGGVTSTTFTLAEGQTSTFVVRAYNAGGTSAAGGPADGTAVPAVPALSVSSVTNTTATFAWTAPSGAVRYEYQQRQNGGAWEAVRDMVAATSVTTEPTTTGNRIDAQVRACNAGGCSAWSPIATAQLTMNLSYFLSNGYHITDTGVSSTNGVGSGMTVSCPSGTIPLFRVQDDWNGWGWTGWMKGNHNGTRSVDSKGAQHGAHYGGTTSIQWQGLCKNEGSGQVSQTYQWDTAVKRSIPAPSGLYVNIPAYRTAGWGASCPSGTTTHYRWWKGYGYDGGGFTMYIDWTTATSWSDTSRAWGSPGPMWVKAWCRSDANGTLSPESHADGVF